MLGHSLFIISPVSRLLHFVSRSGKAVIPVTIATHVRWLLLPGTSGWFSSGIWISPSPWVTTRIPAHTRRGITQLPYWGSGMSHRLLPHSFFHRLAQFDLVKSLTVWCQDSTRTLNRGFPNLIVSSGQIFKIYVKCNTMHKLGSSLSGCEDFSIPGGITNRHKWGIGIGSSPIGYEGFVQPRKGQGKAKPN